MEEVTNINNIKQLKNSEESIDSKDTKMESEIMQELFSNFENMLDNVVVEDSNIPLYVYYRNEDIEKLYKENGGVKTEESLGFDVVTIEDVKFKKGEYGIIDLGIIIKAEKGFRTDLSPRSSTFRKFGIIQTNSVGIIDGDYCGKEDWLGMPVYATRDIVIPKGTAIGQLDIKKAYYVYPLDFDPEEESRGGFGSTDKEWF